MNLELEQIKAFVASNRLAAQAVVDLLPTRSSDLEWDGCRIERVLDAGTLVESNRVSGGIFVRLLAPGKVSCIHWWPDGSNRPVCGHKMFYKAWRAVRTAKYIERFSCKKCWTWVRGMEKLSIRNSLPAREENLMQIRVEVPRPVAARAKYLAAVLEITEPEVMGRMLVWLDRTFTMTEIEDLLRESDSAEPLAENVQAVIQSKKGA